jgi:hypothetical protein
VEEFLTPHSLLMPAFSLVSHPRLGYPAASLATRRSPTDPCGWTTKAYLVHESHSFGGLLEPR